MLFYRLFADAKEQAEFLVFSSSAPQSADRSHHSCKLVLLVVEPWREKKASRWAILASNKRVARVAILETRMQDEIYTYPCSQILQCLSV
jgi:hypothetical protein